MLDQVQCPNCGGYKVNGQVETIKVKTYEPLTRTAAVSQAIAMFILVGLFAIVIMAMSDTRLLLLCPLSLALIGWLVLTPKAKRVREEIVGIIWHYSCILCGYKWDWDPEAPKPEVHIRPDLIAKGQQVSKASKKKKKGDVRKSIVMQVCG